MSTSLLVFSSVDFRRVLVRVYARLERALVRLPSPLVQLAQSPFAHRR